MMSLKRLFNKLDGLKSFNYSIILPLYHLLYIFFNFLHTFYLTFSFNVFIYNDVMHEFIETWYAYGVICGHVKYSWKILIFFFLSECG